MSKILLVAAATAAAMVTLATPASAGCITPTAPGVDTVQVCIDIGLED